MADHLVCAGELHEIASGLGLDVTITTAEPLVDGPYTTGAFVCPHGVRFWMEPTGEQIAEWVRDGVE